MIGTLTAADDLQFGDKIVWHAAGGFAKVARVTLPDDEFATHTSREVTLEGGAGTIRCQRDDHFRVVTEPQAVLIELQRYAHDVEVHLRKDDLRTAAASAEAAWDAASRLQDVIEAELAK